MTKRALVTGSVRRVAAVSASLEAAGFEVSRIEGLDAVTSLADETRPDEPPFDTYVQLPVDVQSRASSVTGQIEALLQYGILLRFRTARSVLSSLAPRARVVLVPGNLPAELSAPDDRDARVALLRVLAHALRADRAPDELSVTVASADHSPEELASLAQGRQVDTPPDYAKLWPDLAYDDWRLAVLGLASIEG